MTKVWARKFVKLKLEKMSPESGILLLGKFAHNLYAVAFIVIRVIFRHELIHCYVSLTGYECSNIFIAV